MSKVKTTGAFLWGTQFYCLNCAPDELRDALENVSRDWEEMELDDDAYCSVCGIAGTFADPFCFTDQPRMQSYSFEEKGDTMKTREMKTKKISIGELKDALAEMMGRGIEDTTQVRVELNDGDRNVTDNILMLYPPSLDIPQRDVNQHKVAMANAAILDWETGNLDAVGRALNLDELERLNEGSYEIVRKINFAGWTHLIAHEICEATFYRVARLIDRNTGKQVVA